MDRSIDDDECGSEVSVESLKDKIELYEFEKEETKIQHDEQKEELGKLKGKHKVLTERYNSLLKRSKEMSNRLEVIHKERLQMDREVARLVTGGGGEYDVEREGNLRDKLNNANRRVTELEEELTLLQVKASQEQEGEAEEKEEMSEQISALKEQFNQLETQLRESESLLVEKENIIEMKEKQVIELEQSLAEKEGELEGERVVLTSLRQQQNDQLITNVLLPRQQPPPIQRYHSRELIGCIRSAQNIAEDVKKNIQPELSDDQMEEIVGLADYIYQVLEEAKTHVATPVTTPTITPITKPTGTPPTSPDQWGRQQQTDNDSINIYETVNFVSNEKVTDMAAQSPRQGMNTTDHDHSRKHTTVHIYDNALYDHSTTTSTATATTTTGTATTNDIAVGTANTATATTAANTATGTATTGNTTTTINTGTTTINTGTATASTITGAATGTATTSNIAFGTTTTTNTATGSATTGTTSATTTMNIGTATGTAFVSNTAAITTTTNDAATGTSSIGTISNTTGTAIGITATTATTTTSDAATGTTSTSTGTTSGTAIGSNTTTATTTNDVATGTASIGTISTGTTTGTAIGITTATTANAYQEQLLQKQLAEHDKEKQLLITQLKEMETQAATSSERESNLRRLVNELESRLTQQSQEIAHSEPSVDKNEWFQQWMKQFGQEKKALNKRIQELETRLGEGSQRVFELQSLVGELEGRLVNETGTGSSPSPGGDQSYIAALHEQISQLREQLMKSPAHQLTTPSKSLGLDVTRAFQRTQNSIGQGNVRQSQVELLKLEKSIAKLLKAVYPQGISSPMVATVTTPSEETDQHSWDNRDAISPATPTQSSHQQLSISISPITVSSSEAADFDEVYSPPSTKEASVAADTMTTPIAKQVKQGTRLFVTLLDYNPRSLCSTGHPERELTLHTGDIVAVTGDMNADGFYNGIFEGRRGLVPAKFLEEMDITDHEAQQRLLNQSLSYSLSQSLHGSEVDITSTPSSHRITPITFTPTVVPPTVDYDVTAAPTQSVTTTGPRPSPPSHLNALLSGDCILVTWRRPNFDSDGQNNGYLVTGYTVKCDGVVQKSAGETDRFTKHVLLEEADPNENHVISVCTQSEQGVFSTEIGIEYNSAALRAEPTISRSGKQTNIRSSQRSQDSIDSDIMKSKLMIAIHDYTPSLDSPNPQPELELKFTKGQTIIVYGSIREDGFYHGEVGDRFGLVPSNFVAESNDDATPHPNDISMTTNPAYIQTPPLADKNKSRRKLFRTT